MKSTISHSFQRPLGPFAVLYEVRQPAQPKSKARNGWQRLLAKRIAAQAKNPDAVVSKAEKILRVNKYSEIGVSTRGAGDRAASIRKTGVC